MSDTVKIIELLKSQIQSSLDCHFYENSTFLAERLHAFASSQDTLFVLANCYYRSGNILRAHQLLQGSQVSSNRFLYAKCCYELNKLQEGEAILVHELSPKNPNSTNLTQAETANIFYLLGLICKKAGRTTQALNYFSKCLQINPLLWGAYENMCLLGSEEDPQNYFGNHQSGNIGLSNNKSNSSHQAKPMVSLLIPSPITKTKQKEPIENSIHQTPPTKSLHGSKSLLARITHEGYFNTPGLSLNDTSLLGDLDREMKVTPLTSKTPHSSSHIPTLSFVSPSPVHFSPQHSSPYSKGEENQQLTGNRGGGRNLASNNVPLRRSSRISSHYEQKESRIRTRRQFSKVGVKTSPNLPKTPKMSPLKPLTKNEKLKEENTTEDKKALHSILSLFLILGKGFRELCHYRCHKAIDFFSELPPNQYQTAWVLCQVGKAYFELADYYKAEKIFKQMRTIDSHQLKGLEFYSTLLWHLHKSVELSYLAHEVEEMYPKSPESWILVGNCFSLQKEHELALKCFHRALQINPDCTYANTLSGHEYVANEDFEKALTCFRNAIRLDKRHYNAWYGLGMVYYRQEKYELALFHFEKALEVNPESSILLCHVGMALHMKGEYLAALEKYDKAIELSPKAPLFRFKRAKTLVSCERLEEALGELEKTRDCAPKESSVYRLMGDIHKKLGNKQKALINLVMAQNLDPKFAGAKSSADKEPDSLSDEEIVF